MDLNSLTPMPCKGLPWQMTICERLALHQILANLRPALGIEIGTYKGGSLQVLSEYCERVVSIDIDPSTPARLGYLFENVTFRVGDSADVLSSVLRQAEGLNRSPSFVLIDGDHSAEGVRRDINALLGVSPSCDIVVLMHDAFNPDCRAGILSANWQHYLHVHEVELDYIPGVYHQKAFDTAAARTMWGGFACALLRPEPRQGDLVISQRQQGLFEAVFLQSSHAPQQSNLMHRAKARVCNLLKSLSR